MIDRYDLKKELEWSSGRAIKTETDRIFDGEHERQKSGTELENEARELAVKKIRYAAQFNAQRRHKFSDDGREFFVAGIQVWKTDVRIIYKPVFAETFDHVGGKREAITERSGKSRKKLSFTVANTETKIVGMIVLTWRTAPMDGKIVKRQLGDLFDAMRRQWGKSIEWLWWMEFQKRGAVHVHIITAGSIHDDLQTVQRVRRGKLRNVFCGEQADWIGQKWLKIIKADKCEKSQAFTRGGIWEKFDKPDGAARYTAKDAWKPHQTTIPKQYQNVGAWWHRSRGFKTPEMISEMLAGEDIIRAGLKLTDGEKLFPVLFNKTKDLK